MKNKNIYSVIFIVLAIAFLFLPATYYGFIDYVIDNTIINMNLERDTIETDKASEAIFNGAKLDFMPSWSLFLLSIIGFAMLYIGIAIKFVGMTFLKKEYWKTFKLLP